MKSIFGKNYASKCLMFGTICMTQPFFVQKLGFSVYEYKFMEYKF